VWSAAVSVRLGPTLSEPFGQLAIATALAGMFADNVKVFRFRRYARALTGGLNDAAKCGTVNFSPAKSATIEGQFLPAGGVPDWDSASRGLAKAAINRFNVFVRYALEGRAGF
jgi:hypothetical protein